MKVLKEGKWKMKWEKKVVCKERMCGAVLLIDGADILNIRARDSNLSSYYVICPSCRNHVHVSDYRDLPMQIQDVLEREYWEHRRRIWRADTYTY